MLAENQPGERKKVVKEIEKGQSLEFNTSIFYALDTMLITGATMVNNRDVVPDLLGCAQEPG